jgi:peptidoglycan/LPS O-acetylase OafA/YrhL
MDMTTTTTDDAAAAGEAPAGISPPSGWRYVPGLDGIRALAVLSVLAFHAGVSGIGGGLLGVDIFFVLSGFLITSLLVTEFSLTATIGFLAFYGRRARRLLPALAVTLLMVAFYALLVADPGTRATIRGDAFATMAYVANWRFIITHQNYFVFFGPPSPLLHTWSLAVEEQFYLVWPALSLFVLKRRGANGLFVVAVILAIGSAIDSFVLLHTGASTTRMYYGTDLRVQEVMVGAALAAWWGGTQGEGHKAHRTSAPSEHKASRQALSVAGILGLGGLLWALHAVNGMSSFLYGGGFLLIAGLTALVIASVVKLPDGIVGQVLSLRPLRYIGQISYGLYLYHYPIFLAMTAKSHLTGNALLAAKFAVTFAVAAASARLIEEPVRRHRALSSRRLLIALPIVTAVVIAALVVCTLPGVGAEAAIPQKVTKQLRTSLPAPGPPLPADQQVRAVVFGDSMTEVATLGLSVSSSSWGVRLINDAAVGCDLLPQAMIEFQGGPPTPMSTGCLGWQQHWAQIIASEDPDVVIIGVGRWEVLNRLIDGQWDTIADAPLQQEISTALDQAIKVASAGGAQVVLLTLPYVKGTSTQPDGSAWDLNQPWRTDEFNSLVRQAAARHPGVATVVDENKILDPKGVYTDFIGSIRVRNTDEEHPTVGGGMYMRPLVLPVVHRLGLAHLWLRLAEPTAPGAPAPSGPQSPQGDLGSLSGVA